MKILHSTDSFPLAVPTDVVVCPYCTDPQQLTIDGVESFEQHVGPLHRFWFATGVDVNCPKQDWDDPNCHTYMPYVNWLPVHQLIEDWMKARFCFDIDRENRAASLKPSDYLRWPSTSEVSP